MDILDLPFGKSDEYTRTINDEGFIETVGSVDWLTIYEEREPGNRQPVVSKLRSSPRWIDTHDFIYTVCRGAWKPKRHVEHFMSFNESLMAQVDYGLTQINLLEAYREPYVDDKQKKEITIKGSGDDIACEYFHFNYMGHLCDIAETGDEVARELGISFDNLVRFVDSLAWIYPQVSKWVETFSELEQGEVSGDFIQELVWFEQSYTTNQLAQVLNQLTLSDS